MARFEGAADMAVEFVDGTIAPTEPKRIKRGYGQFPELVLITSSGERRTLNKVFTGPQVTDEVRRGGAGRFCFDRVDGAIALVGVRRPDGTKVFSWHTNVHRLSLFVGILGTFMAVLRFGFGVTEVPLLAWIFGPPLLALAFYMERRKQTARAAFEADSG